MKVPDWAVKNKSDEKALELGYYWDETEYLKLKRFISTFCIQRFDRWRGKPIKLLEFQERDILAPLYCWKQPDGKRRFDSLYCFGPKKFGVLRGFLN